MRARHSFLGAGMTLDVGYAVPIAFRAHSRIALINTAHVSQGRLTAAGALFAATEVHLRNGLRGSNE